MGTGRGRRGAALLTDTVWLWAGRNAFQHAAALAFYTLFSLTPLLIILIAIVGAVFGRDAAQGRIAADLDALVGSQAAAAVEDAVRRSTFSHAGVLPTVLGVVALAFGATTVFAQMQSALNEIWGVAGKPSRGTVASFLWTRLVSLGLVLIIGFLLLTSLVISATVTAVVQFAQAWLPVPVVVAAGLDLVVSLLVATLLFGMIFKVLPDVRLHWGHTIQGAAVTAVLFVSGQGAISWYLTRMAPSSTYGAAGSLVVVLMWVYYSALILYFGAALTRVAMDRRGERIVPKSTAVRVRVQTIEDDPEAGQP